MADFLGPVVAQQTYEDAAQIGPTFPVSYINLVCDQPVYVTCFKPVTGPGIIGKWTLEGTERYIPTTQLTGVTITNVCGLKIRSATATLATVQAELAYPTDPQFSGLPSAVNVDASVTGAPGTLLRVTVVDVPGAGTFVVGSGTNQIRARLVGGGGGGHDGGGAGNAGSGGGSGGYVDTGLIAVTPSTGYAYTVGDAGIGGSPPTDGTDTTLIVGLFTYLAGGGHAGQNGPNYKSGGAPGGYTGGILRSNGQWGGSSTTLNAGTYYFGGDGGDTPLGEGGRGPNAAGSDQNATLSSGYGSGGGGGVRAGVGSDGSPGVLIIEEYA